MPSCLAHQTFSSLLPDTSCTFLCFGTISLILKHERLLRRRAIFIKTADQKQSSAWNFIKKNTPSPFFKFYNEDYSTKSRYTQHILWQNFYQKFPSCICISKSYTRVADSKIYWYNIFAPSHVSGGYNSLLPCTRYLKQITKSCSLVI